MSPAPLRSRSQRGIDLPPFDRSVPVLLFKVGRYPLHYGSLAAVRTLAAVGVRTFAITEDPYTPTARSRHLAGRFVWPTSGTEDPRELLARLLAFGERIGVRSMLLPTDDEAAVLVAEHADVLAERFLLPRVGRDLPRRLASKHVLAELCAAHGVATPTASRPSSIAELFELAMSTGFPLVLKNDAPWERIWGRAVEHTTVINDLAQLERVAEGWRSLPGLVVQEYLPHEHTKDWSVHVYRCSEADAVLAFTGVVLRSYPAYAGVTVEGLTVANEELRELAVSFCQAVGFRGVAGLNWRYDLRDGQYKLLDFNVRAGAKFRMFETEQGIDVVRAMHLDLTQRRVPLGREVQQRRYVVGNLALAAALGYRGDHALPLIRRAPSGGVERAWLRMSDPLPGLLAALRSLPAAGALLASRLRVRRRGGSGSPSSGAVEPRGGALATDGLRR